jgi:hypothetical protein
LKQDLDGRAKILKTVLEKCYLRGKNLEDTYVVWRPPYDSLFNISQVFRENQAEVIKNSIRGGLIYDLRTFLRRNSIAYQINQLSQWAL